MNPPQRTEAERIAGMLTKAQRALVLRGSAGGDEAMSTIRSCISKGVMHLRIDSPNGRCGFVENTPLGLAVRARLLSQDQIDER